MQRKNPQRMAWMATGGNPWKLVALGMGVIFATALTTGVVVAHYVGSRQEPQSMAANAPQGLDTGAQNAGVQPAPGGGAPGQQAAVQPPVAPPAAEQAVPPPPQAPAAGEQPPSTTHRHRVAARPSTADIEDCNHYARASHDRTGQTVTDALVGGLAGAGLGAASGAIAGGGGGAGKGAGIGGLVGVAAGTLYGLNEANKGDAQAAAAYRSCMRRRGYTD
jgi:hypothetical protein